MAAEIPDTELDHRVGADAPTVRRLVLFVCGAAADRIVPLAEGATVVAGREPSCEVPLDDPKVSRRHVAFVLRGDVLEVEDLRSSNGARLNGRVFTGERRVVGPGDTVRVGDTDLVVASIAAPPDAEAGDEEAPDLVVVDRAMAKLEETARRLARTPATVLVTGEMGTGKETLARAIHAWSDRRERPFVAVDCAALPKARAEAELFGREAGAEPRAASRVAAADGGTLFLGDVAELPLPAQARLLRALEDPGPAGSGTTRPPDVRVIAATHRELRAEVAAGRFREDLASRLGTFTLAIPPLRERVPEVRRLAAMFVHEFATKLGLPEPRLGASAIARLEAYRWPGNLRELKNAVEHAVVLGDGPSLEERHLPEAVRGGAGGPPASLPAPAWLAEPGGRADEPTATGVRGAVAEAERRSIEEALLAEGNNRTRAAKRLGIARRTLIYKMIKHGMPR